MAKKDESATEHMASGSLPKRALKVILERIAHNSGEKLAASALSDSIIGRITATLGGTAIPEVLFERAGDIAAILIQDPGLGRAFAGMLGLPADLAQELTNEGLDKFLTGYFDAVREMKGKTGRDLDTAMRAEADLAINRISGDLAAKHPHLVRKVWFDCSRGIAHVVGCDMVQYKKNVERGDDGKGIPIAQAFARGGRMAKDCDCIGARDSFRGSLQDALAECHPSVQVAFNELLASDEGKKEAAKILDAGRRRQDITPSHLWDIVERCMDPMTQQPNRSLQLDKLRSLVGVQAPAAAAEPSRLRQFFSKVGARALGMAETLASPRDSQPREDLRKKIEDDTKAVRDANAKRRKLWEKQ